MSQEPTSGISPEDITVDDQGRVVILNPQLAERVKRAVAAPDRAQAAPGINNQCNTVRNCGCPIVL
jgi:hypothetical protein